MSQRQVPRFVLTGGPCSGKTTALSILAQKLPDYGVTPLFVPEVATLIFNGGVRIQDILKNRNSYIDLQRQILRAQLFLEDIWDKLVEVQPGNQKVVICDRGIMDGQAYMTQSEFLSLLGEFGLDVFGASDRRYNAVFHLVTAACGAREHYSLDNPARYETPEQALEVDTATIHAWMGHPSLTILPNILFSDTDAFTQIDFQEKMNRLVRAVCRKLALPAPLQIGKKFVVEIIGEFGIETELFCITQTYLSKTNDGAERRVRSRMRINSVTGKPVEPALRTYAEKKKIASGKWQKTERIITERELSGLMNGEIAESQRTAVKKRRSFIWNHQYFQLDEFIFPDIGLNILEIEPTEKNDTILIPPFLRAILDVTDNPHYTNEQIATV